MRIRPILHGAAASAYIWAAVLLIHTVSPGPDTPDTLLTPIFALSLLVFSVATMGFIFFYQPVVLLIAGRRDEAVRFFGLTLGSFGIITALTLLLATSVFGLSI